jgi:hypothetical protein
MGVACCYYSEVRPKRGDKSKGSPTDYEKVATELTILADKALFRAKKAGRNQLVISKDAIELSRFANKP